MPRHPEPRNEPDIEKTLAELAVTRPAATGVFFQRQLDFCCGGGQTLSQVCRSVGQDPNEVLADIARAEGEGGPSSERWDLRPLSELIDHIEGRYHAPLRGTLPGLIAAARTVERVHADKPTCPRGLTGHLEAIQVAVEEHLEKEEKVLFPLIRAGRGRDAHLPVRVMVEEHEDHGDNLRRLRELTGDLTAPPQACQTWRGLYEALLHLEAELMEHIHLENNVLFPRALAE